MTSKLLRSLFLVGISLEHTSDLSRRRLNQTDQFAAQLIHGRQFAQSLNFSYGQNFSVHDAAANDQFFILFGEFDNRFGSRSRQAQLSRSVTVLGAADNFSGGETRAVVEELSRRELYRSLLER